MNTKQRNQLDELYEEKDKMDDASFNELIKLKKDLITAKNSISHLYSYLLKNKNTVPEDSLLSLTGEALLFIEDLKKMLDVLKQQIMNFNFMLFNNSTR